MKKIHYSSIIKIATILTAVTAMVYAVPVSAQVTGSSTHRFRSNAGMNASTTQGRMMQRQARQASSTAMKIEKGQQKGDGLIDKRIGSLNDLVTRVNGMKHLSDSDKSSLENSLNSEITQLTGLKNQIGNDTSTTSLKADVGSITKSYRIFALVEPQAKIISAGDRVLTVVSSLNTILAKVNTRLASSTLDASTTSAVQTSLTDFSVKITDASAQANAAISEVTGLKPDNGDTTIAASNKAALKDAQAKIKVAQSDLKTAQKDIRMAVKEITGHN